MQAWKALAALRNGKQVRHKDMSPGFYLELSRDDSGERRIQSPDGTIFGEYSSIYWFCYYPDGWEEYTEPLSTEDRLDALEKAVFGEKQ